MKSIAKRSVLFLFIFVVILGGCGSSSSSGSEGHSKTSSSASGKVSTSGNKDPHTLIIGLDDDPPQLDPAKSQAAVDRQVYQSLYNTLVGLNQDLKFEPELAKSWDITNGGKTYTFHLRHDVKFQDGTKFNAKAVKFNFDRMLDPDTHSPRQSDIKVIKNVKVVDPYTIQIQLKKPYSPFLAVLTDRAGMMVSPTAVKKEGKNFSNHPVGTGPYKFVNRVQQDHIKLTRFDGYWGDKPSIKNVVYKPFPDGNVRVKNLLYGNVDIVNQIPFKDIDKLKSSSNVKLSVKPALGFQGIMLNTDAAPFNNKKVRQAINLIVNRQAIAKVVFHNGVTPATSPFPPSSWAHPGDLKVPKPNLKKAKQLIQESGLSNIHFTLKVEPKPEEKQLGQMLQSMLGQIGIKVKLEMVEFGALLEQMKKGNYQAIRIGWSGRTDPDGNVFTWFASKGSLNDMGYSNPKLDKLLKQARTTSDRGKRKQLYDKVAHILWEDVPYVFLYYPKDYKVMKNHLKGFIHMPTKMIRTAPLHFK